METQYYNFGSIGHSIMWLRIHLKFDERAVKSRWPKGNDLTSSLPIIATSIGFTEAVYTSMHTSFGDVMVGILILSLHWRISTPPYSWICHPRIFPPWPSEPSWDVWTEPVEHARVDVIDDEKRCNKRLCLKSLAIMQYDFIG